MSNRYNDYDRAAGGMDYDDAFRERANTLGSTLAESGPEALFQQVEEMLPESWKENIRHFPITALVIGFGVGIFLGMKKGDELISAGSSLIAAAATANLNSVLRDRAQEEE